MLNIFNMRTFETMLLKEQGQVCERGSPPRGHKECCAHKIFFVFK